MSVNPSRTTPQHIGFGYGLRMRLATGAGGYWLRLALFLSDSRSDDQPLPIAHTIARKLLAKLRRGHIDRIFKAVSAGRAGPHVSNAISGEMFRAFRCDDIATALHALIQRYSTHETFPLLVAIFAAWIAPQCGSVMAGDRLAAIFPVAFYPSAPYRRR